MNGVEEFEDIGRLTVKRGSRVMDDKDDVRRVVMVVMKDVGIVE